MGGYSLRSGLTHGLALAFGVGIGILAVGKNYDGGVGGAKDEASIPITAKESKSSMDVTAREEVFPSDSGKVNKQPVAENIEEKVKDDSSKVAAETVKKSALKILDPAPNVVRLEDLMLHPEALFGRNLYRQRDNICNLINELLAKEYEKMERPGKWPFLCAVSHFEDYGVDFCRTDGELAYFDDKGEPKKIPTRSYAVNLRLPNGKVGGGFETGPIVTVEIDTWKDGDGSYAIRSINISNSVDTDQLKQYYDGDFLYNENLVGITLSLTAPNEISVSYQAGRLGWFRIDPAFGGSSLSGIKEEDALKFGLQRGEKLDATVALNCWRANANRMDDIWKSVTDE